MVNRNIKNKRTRRTHSATTRFFPLLIGMAGIGCLSARPVTQPPPVPPDGEPPAAAGSPAPPARPPSSPAEMARRVHDPCIIRDGAYCYVFSTGTGIPVRRSRDLRAWEPIGSVFGPNMPDWVRREMPDSRGAWAPDISFARERFQLYYAVSRFGSNHSVIGLASTKTLEPASPDYGWRDEGKVFESSPGQNYNAIDPNFIQIAPDRAALTFGSFWSGIKLVFVDVRTGKPAPGARIYDLAQRPSPDALEAPFLIRHGDRYYLFVSFDLCCRGLSSTYNIRVGRSRDVTGPYIDREGRPMLAGGGTPVLMGQGREIGPGHCAVLQDAPQVAAPGKAAKAGQDYLVYHYYDWDAKGAARLQIRPLAWTPDGWPVAGDPLIPPPTTVENKQQK